MAKILLVEDDNNLREIFEMRLAADGYKTVTASDGEEALVVAMKEKPDLIIADVMMPKLSGFEMLETLRAAPEMKNVKVVMMTALGQAEDRTRGERLGVVKYLVKSQVTLEDFVRVVREVLQPGQADAETNAPAPATDSTEASKITNKLESEQSMQDDTQQNNPAAPSGSDNPISGTPGDDAGSTDGQMSTADEKAQVDQQVNDFAAGAPSVPGGDAGSAGDDTGTAGTSTPGGDVPSSAPPAGDSGSGSGDAAGGDTSNPTGPATPAGGDSQV